MPTDAHESMHQTPPVTTSPSLDDGGVCFRTAAAFSSASAASTLFRRNLVQNMKKTTSPAVMNTNSHANTSTNYIAATHGPVTYTFTYQHQRREQQYRRSKSLN